MYTRLLCLFLMLIAPALMAPSCFFAGTQAETPPSLYCDAQGGELKTPPVVGWVYKCGTRLVVVDTDPTDPAYEYGDYVGIEAAEKCSGAGFNGCTSVGPYSAFECEVHWAANSEACGEAPCITMTFIEGADVTAENAQDKCEQLYRAGEVGGATSCEFCRPVAPNAVYKVAYTIECVDTTEAVPVPCTCSNVEYVSTWSCFAAQGEMRDKCNAECDPFDAWGKAKCVALEWVCEKQ